MNYDLMHPDILTIEKHGNLPNYYQDDRTFIGECHYCGYEIHRDSGFKHYNFNGYLLCSDCVDYYKEYA